MEVRMLNAQAFLKIVPELKTAKGVFGYNINLFGFSIKNNCFLYCCVAPHHYWQKGSIFGPTVR